MTAPPELSGPLLAEVEAFLDHEPSTMELVSGKAEGLTRVGLVLKRTYQVGPDGRCELASDNEQELVVDRFVLYHDLEAPASSPVSHDADTGAFRKATDLVVQGYANTYGKLTDRTLVAIGVGDFRREIRVYGARRAEWTSEAKVRFTQPEPFDLWPVRYDYAYGGCDRVALSRWHDPEFEALKADRPEYELDRATPCHYARNPTGKGFLVGCDEESVAAVEVPNLEFPFDPITPERLAVGSTGNWLAAPLPACMDWTSPHWFPRSAYMGLAPRSNGEGEVPVTEVEQGWAPPDLLQIPSILQPPHEMRPEAAQGASPGLSFPHFDPGQEIVLENMHPEQPVWRVRLPGEIPHATLGLEVTGPTPLTPHLNAVVLRPEYDEVVAIWCAEATTMRGLSGAQARNLERRVDWRRPGGGN